MEMMSDGRHRALVKAAEDTMDEIEQGADPTSALTKVAKAADLNSNEVKLVADQVNNALTVSHLAESEDTEKDSPFPLTNASTVQDELFPADPSASLEDHKSELKKAAADASLFDDQVYIGHTYDHSADLAAAFGLTHSPTYSHTKLATAPEEVTEQTTKSHLPREFSNPFEKLSAVRNQVEELRTRATGLTDGAADLMGKIALAFRQVSAPDHREVCKIAAHLGTGEETMGLVLRMARLDMPQIEKVAAHTTLYTTPDVQALAEDMYRAEQLWKEAGVHRGLLQQQEQLLKQAEQLCYKLAAKGDKAPATPGAEANEMAIGETGHLSRAIGDFPELVVGDDPNALMLGVTDTAGEGNIGKGLPTGADAKQRLANTEAAATLYDILEDDYIAAQPLDRVVGAYNQVIDAGGPQNPSVVSEYVRRVLAQGGELGADDALRLNEVERKATKGDD